MERQDFEAIAWLTSRGCETHLMTASSHPFEPLSVQGFRRLWVTSIFFGTANSMQVVAGNWLMLQLTGSPLWVGLMVATPTLPMLLVALPSGALADIIERRRVLILSTLLLSISASGMLLLYVVGHLTPGRLLALGFIGGVGLSIYAPVWQALISDLVPRPLLTRAISLNSASGAVSMALGPLLGGLSMARYSFLVPATAATAGYAILLVGLITAPRFERHGKGGSTLRSVISTGLRHVRHSTGYRVLLVVAAAFGVGSAALRALLPSIVETRLLSESGTYGIVLGAMGVGALVGALFRERLQSMLGDRLLTLSVSVYASMSITVALSRSLVLSAVAMASAGVAWTVTLSTLQSQFQLRAPDWVRARALSIYNVALLGMMTVGTVTSGVLGSVFGPSTALTISALALFVLALWIRTHRTIAGSDESDPQPIGSRPAEGHPDIDSDQPVMVATVWTIAPDRIDEFFVVMEDLRRVRLTTGAHRWTLYRDVVRPEQFTEVFEVDTWAQHLEQHTRLDVGALETIRSAVGMDAGGSPRSVHLVGIDPSVGSVAMWSPAGSIDHVEMHRSDGSIGLAVDEELAVPITPVAGADGDPQHGSS